MNASSCTGRRPTGWRAGTHASLAVALHSRGRRRSRRAPGLRCWGHYALASLPREQLPLCAQALWPGHDGHSSTHVGRSRFPAASARRVEAGGLPSRGEGAAAVASRGVASAEDSSRRRCDRRLADGQAMIPLRANSRVFGRPRQASMSPVAPDGVARQGPLPRRDPPRSSASFVSPVEQQTGG